MTDECCLTCRFYRQPFGESGMCAMGECRRMPKSEEKRGFCWCGEWSQKKRDGKGEGE